MALLGEQTYALITTGTRAIGTLIPDVVISEGHRDGLIITQHPVENGGIITDHAFKRPAELEMVCGWSDSTVGYVGYARQVYEGLQQLQAARQPFNITTGKRRYKNMLLRELSVQTDKDTENSLVISASFQEVIIVSTQTTNTGSDTTGAGDGKGNQANPASTDTTAARGGTQGVPITDTNFNGSFNPGQTDVGQGSNYGSFGDYTTLPGLTVPGSDIGPSVLPETPNPGTGTGSGTPSYNIWEFG